MLVVAFPSHKPYAVPRFSSVQTGRNTCVWGSTHLRDASYCTQLPSPTRTFHGMDMWTYNSSTVWTSMRRIEALTSINTTLKGFYDKKYTHKSTLWWINGSHYKEGSPLRHITLYLLPERFMKPVFWIKKEQAMQNSIFQGNIPTTKYLQL
jgi:hypothetical protein